MLRRPFQDPFIDALVPAAGEDQLVLLGELVGGGLGEALPRRRRDNQHRLAPGTRDTGTLCSPGALRIPGPGARDGREGLRPGLGLHDHAGAAAVGGVIDRPVPVGGELAQVVDPQVQQAVLAGLADQGQLQRCQVLREDADDVDPHLRVALPFGVPGSGVLGSRGRGVLVSGMLLCGLFLRCLLLGGLVGVDLEESGRRGDAGRTFRPR